MDTTIEVDNEDSGSRPGSLHVEWMIFYYLDWDVRPGRWKTVIIQTYLEINRTCEDLSLNWRCLRFRSDLERTGKWIVCQTLYSIIYDIVDLY